MLFRSGLERDRIEGCQPGVAPRFRVEVSREGLPEVWEKEGGELAPGDSVRVTCLLEGIAPGRHLYRARLSAEADQDSSNNRVSFEVVAGALAGQAAINEVMFAPREGGSEWIELLNRSEQILDLSGWQVQDSRAEADVFSNVSLKVPPGWVQSHSMTFNPFERFVKLASD